MRAPTYAGTINRYRLEYDERLSTQQVSPSVIPADMHRLVNVNAETTPSCKGLVGLSIGILSIMESVDKSHSWPSIWRSCWHQQLLMYHSVGELAVLSSTR